MTDPTPTDAVPLLDLTALRQAWAARQADVAAVRARINLTGLRRPARDAEEQAWLCERGEVLFIEDEAAGEAARRYYARKYTRPRD